MFDMPKSKILKSDLRRAIRAEGGNIKRVAEMFDVTRQTIYNKVDRYDLRGEVETYRAMVFRMAEDNLFGAVEEGDTDISKFVVTHFPGGQRWSSKQEIRLGAIQLDDEVLALAEKMGIEVETIAEQFERLIREEAARVDG